MSSQTSDSSEKRHCIWHPNTFIFNRKPVKLQLIVDGRTHTWYLNKALLARYSPKFRDLFRTTDTVLLDSSTVGETVESFTSWILTGFLVPEFDYSSDSYVEDAGYSDEDLSETSVDIASSSSIIGKSEESSKGIAIPVKSEESSKGITVPVESEESSQGITVLAEDTTTISEESSKGTAIPVEDTATKSEESSKGIASPVEDTATKSEGSSKGIAIPVKDTITKPWFLKFSGTDQTYGRLLDLYLFAIKYDVRKLQTKVLVQWKRHAFNNQCHLGQEILCKALLALPPGDALIRFQVADYGYTLLQKSCSTGLDYDRLPAPFTVELLKFTEEYSTANEVERRMMCPDYWNNE